MQKLLLPLFVFLSCAAVGEEPWQQAQRAAQAALQSQMSQVGKDCPAANTTIEINGCLAKVLKATESDFDEFYRNLLMLVGRGEEAGNVQNLRDSQAAWTEYRDKACNAIYQFYRTGSIRDSAELRCNIDLTRGRMRDLDGLYEAPLHH